MATHMILAEKPKQALAYAEALKPYKKMNGFIEIYPNEIFPEGAYLTWAFGHLVELAKPNYYDDKWKTWNLKSLPIKPDEFIYQVSKNKEEQMGIITSLMKKVEVIVVGTDSDREGENIAWSIIKHAKADHKVIKRLWINSLEVDVIEKGFRNLKNGQDYYSSYIEAQTRQISDWLIGMNASQLFTLLLQEKGIKETFSVGRVQTPTLYMIYQREQEIKNFVAKPFYELTANVHHQNGTFTVKAEGKFENKEEALTEFQNNHLKENTKLLTEISKVSKTEEKEPSPLLYTMSGIQTKANRQWKYSPARVLEIVQSLYEKKLLTYPRTDTPYITESEFAYIKSNVHDYQKIIGHEFEIAQPEPQKRFVNSEFVQEHHAIVPTKNIPSAKVISELGQEELNIYHEVIKNTLSMFHEPYRFNKTIIEVQHENLVFKTTGKVEVSKGWKSLYPKPIEDNKKDAPTPLPDVDSGDPIQLTPLLKEGKTTKPKRLTEGDLIPLMIHAGKRLESDEQAILKESEGIGTEATRANIIETLKKQEYIEVKKNLVTITLKGVILCDVVDGSLLSSPSLTAKWETFLKKIGKGERDQETFLNGIYQFIDKLLEEIPVKMSSKTLTASIEERETENHIGKCPTCEKGFIVAREAFYGCSSSKEGCKQTLSKKILNKSITEPQIKKLLNKGKTDLIKGFKGKKEFDAYLTLIPDDTKGTKKYQFNF